jgi:hypothetical protein
MWIEILRVHVVSALEKKYQAGGPERAIPDGGASDALAL